MVPIQKSWNCLMGPTTGVTGGHMCSIDLFSWETGALFRCGCENTKEWEVCGKLFSSWRDWCNFCLLLQRNFSLICVVTKFVVFFSQLCCALRKRPKEGCHRILVQNQLWLPVVLPLIVLKLWSNLSLTAFLTLFCFKICLLTEPQGKCKISHWSAWC